MNMQKNEKRKRPGLKQKLKYAVESISVDVFGYEKKVTKNAVAYLDKAARELRVPYEQLFARIVKQNVTVRVYLHHQGRQLKEVPVRELVLFFAGQEATVLGLESRVADSISKYLDELAKENEIHLDLLHVRISGSGNKVIVGAYNNHLHVKDIPVKDLVKHFKA